MTTDTEDQADDRADDQGHEGSEIPEGGGPKTPGGRLASLPCENDFPQTPVLEPQRLSPEPPDDLGEAGSALWVSMAAAPLLLWPQERAMVLSACRETDLAEECARVVAAEGVSLPWGRGGSRAHPLLSKVAEHRGLAARLLRSLQMPPEPKSERGGGRRRRGVYGMYRTGAR